MNLIKFSQSSSIGVRELKANLSSFVNQPNPIVITSHGKPKKVMVPYDELLELIDLLDEVQDEQLVKQVRDGRQAYLTNPTKAVSVSRLWEELDLEE